MEKERSDYRTCLRVDPDTYDLWRRLQEDLNCTQIQVIRTALADLARSRGVVVREKKEEYDARK